MKKLILYLIILLNCQLIFASKLSEKLLIANEVFYSNPDSSYIICKALEKIESKTKIELAEIYICQSRYLILKTEFDEASLLLAKAINLLEKENNLSLLAKCYSLKSILLNRISNEEQALFHQKKAISLYTEAKDTTGIISSLTNISLDYLDKEENDSALYYLSKLKRFEEKMKESSKYYFHQNFGTYYFNVRNYGTAIQEYNKALEIANKHNMIDSKATCLTLIATTYFNLKNYAKAESTLLKSITIAENNNLLHEANEAYIVLIELYEKQKDFKKALEVKKLNDKIEKEIFTLEKINKINEIETRLRLTEKERIITKQELKIKKEQLNTLEAKSKISQLIYFILLCIVIIVFVIIIFIRAKKLTNKIKTQKLLLEVKSKEVTDSIKYAKRIQSAILPSIKTIKEHLQDSFILYKPKDIVAGDFYWLENKNNTVLFAAADCTGHGVPGAMVSVICNNGLNRSVREYGLTNPSEILNKTREIVISEFEKSEEDVRDGMDIALCSIKYKIESEKSQTTAILQYAGANNPLWIIRPINNSEHQKLNFELIDIRPDKQPIGKHFKNLPFTSHTIELQKGDSIYIFSDGYADQFGGPKGKKFMYKPLKNLLLSIQDKNMNEQKEILEQRFNDWKGDLEQVDDVCMIGVRI
ncbi:MAG: SpoIIE family protein phosphatase [Flavobacteriales bacterium]|nr:SpoIIE family protein phosphatase [Flavobacteriales bacterium]MCW8912007.1 SpoIIE family protein phosphatase [Flavobacteriales bacterium]MCW8936647.1 SpoIIE family protein phosphatase [Flavobacteriales bacterium]MCW8968689.1 SpoIIE family protein phosphatase [Flavobacteriales bacterium]MCW8990429.1 SpoIIE family protein phosphatase [Flavobacteriales bacterium]